MEKIYQHIEKLLCKHDYVVVPELGGFVLQYKPAEILESKITPPLMTIAFNPLMKHSDGLLAIEISRAENINYREANTLLTKEVKQLKEEFLHTHTIAFGKLGHLQCDENQNFIFIPTNNPDFLPANFALQSIPVAKLLQKTNHYSINPYRKANTWKKVAAIALIALGMTYLANEHTTTTNTANLLSALSPSSRIQIQPSIVITNDTTELADSATLAAQATASSDTIQQAPVQLEEVKKNQYHVIVGSWAGEKSASRHCEQLKTLSYSNVHVIHPDKGYHVALRTFDDKEQALKYMQDIRHAEKKFAAAWVLCEE